jgi:ATP-dependent Clp protease ATP-binding subunit ClpB
MSSTTRSWRLDGYAQDAKVYLTGAQSLADDRGHVEVESLHLLYRLLDRDAYTQKVFEAAGIDPGDLLVECEAVLRKLPQVPGAVAFVSPRLFGTSTRAEAEAARDASPVRVRHLVAALVSEVAGLTGAVLRSLDVNEQRVRDALKAVPEGPMVTTESTTAPSFGGGGGGGGGSGGGGGAAGNALAQYTRDLIAEASAERYDPIVGRDGELRRMLQVLARRQKNNPLLVGEPGVGKRSIAYALATRLAQGDVPAPLKKKRLMQLDLGLLVAGARLRGELEDRLRAGTPGRARRRGGHHPLR